MRIILLLCFPALLFSQNSLNPRVNKFDESINYFFIEETHPGIIFKNQETQYDCFSENYYAFTQLYWQNQSENYLKKVFQRCSESDVENTDSKILKFVINNFEEIKKEEILPFETIKHSLIMNHQPKRKYGFHKNGAIFSKEFETYYLTGEGENINYESNQKLKIIELDSMIRY